MESGALVVKVTMFTLGVLIAGCASLPSQMDVVAHATREIAGDGSQSLPSVVAYVRDSQGQPVTGLAEANFSVREVTSLPADPMSLVGFLDLSNIFMPGIYRMSPQFNPGPLKADGFIFVIGVKKSPNQTFPDAQALAPLLK